VLKNKIKISSSDPKFILIHSKSPTYPVYPIQAFSVSSDAERVALVSLFHLDRAERATLDRPPNVKAEDTQHQLCYTPQRTHLFHVYRNESKTLEVFSYRLTSERNGNDQPSPLRSEVSSEDFDASCSNPLYNVRYQHQDCILLDVTLKQ